jgi:outer membrane protein assembly factor BamB
MTGPMGQRAHAPTVLAVSRFGTLWLLDACSGAQRWQLVNGSHLATIDHGGQMIYITYTSTREVRRDTRNPPLRSELPWHLNRPPEEVRKFRELLVTPAEILALRAEDGSVAWRRAGWVSRSQPLPLIPGGHRLDGDLLLTDVTDYAEATPAISALDALTGAVRWRYTGIETPEMGPTSAPIQLEGACAGRVYISVPGGNRLDVPEPEQCRLHVLDTASGELAWTYEHNTASKWHLSPGGALVAELDREANRSVIVRRASDGGITARVSLSPLTTFHGLTDSGIAYLAGGPEWHRWVEAIDTSTGETVWHAERDVPLLSTNMDISLFEGTTFATPASLYVARLNYTSGLAEMLAVSAQSGRQRWYWHSPAHLPGLLKLWGWQTPRVVAFAFSQFRRSLKSRRKQANQSMWNRLRSLWDTSKWEILHGQWLRPASLLSDVFSAGIYPGDSATDDQLYIGTSMGLSALRGRDRKLLWHKLLMMEITSVIPEQRTVHDRVAQPPHPVGAASFDG